MSKQLTLSAFLSVMMMVGFAISTYDAPTDLLVANGEASAITQTA